MLLVVRYVLRFWGTVGRERSDLVLENITLRHHLEVLTRNRRRPPLQSADRLLWSSLARVWLDRRRHVVIVQPDTVVRWHRNAWRRYWTWRSRGPRRGRPRIDAEVAILIRRMTTENPRWGHMRALGELRKLGFQASLQTVRRYRKDVPSGGGLTAARDESQGGKNECYELRVHAPFQGREYYHFRIGNEVAGSAQRSRKWAEGRATGRPEHRP